MSTKEKTFTLTFGDQAENHVGMQKIGAPAPDGFGLDDLVAADRWFRERGAEGEFVPLHHWLPVEHAARGGLEAYVLVVRGGLDALLAGRGDSDAFFAEQDALPKDEKALMYGRVVNKRARHNLCFADEAQAPDYANGFGTVVAYDSVPLLRAARDALPDALGPKARGLAVEGNYYHDAATCGIGFHGDSERKRVVGVRVGSTMPLHFQWFRASQPLGETARLSLGHGDLYVMSEKATGNDWNKRTVPTLRHAAGAPRFLQVVAKKKKNSDDVRESPSSANATKPTSSK